MSHPKGLCGCFYLPRKGLGHGVSAGRQSPVLLVSTGSSWELITSLRINSQSTGGAFSFSAS